jgi:hypothetical protein
VQPLAPHGVRVKLRTEIGPTDQPQVERVTRRAGRRAVEREIEALEAQLRVEVKRGRETACELDNECDAGSNVNARSSASPIGAKLAHQSILPFKADGRVVAVNLGGLRVVDDEVCDWKGEAT